MRGPILTAPGPRSSEMLRAFRQISTDPLAFLMHMRTTHGPLVQFPIPVPPSYFVADVPGVRRVLVENSRAYDKQTMQYRGLAALTGEGLLTSDGSQWRAARGVVQPAFHHDAVTNMQATIAAVVDTTADRWQALSSLDIEAEMMRMSLEIVGRTLFNADLSDEAADLSEATIHALDAVVSLAQRPWIRALHLPARATRDLRRALVQLESAVAHLVAHRLANPVEQFDMLGMLMHVHGVTDADVIPSAVRDEIVTFIVAGHETVASSLTWAWHLLMSHPQVYDRLLETNEQVYARAIFEEVLRLYPPAWLITRRSIEADYLSGVEIPEGSLIIMSPWVIHRDPQWWQEPEHFNPDRFLGPSDSRRLAYIPFGIGQRMCIGREMALVEGSMALAKLAQRIRLEREGSADIGRIASVTLRPATHIRARVRSR